MGDPKTPNFIKSLVNYVKNNGTKDDIYDSDSSIYHIDTKKPLGKTEITVDFEGDEPFLDAIGLGDDDKYFLKIENNRLFMKSFTNVNVEYYHIGHQVLIIA